VILGIDTSCYTTSLALLREDGSLVAHYQKPLKVAEGKKGLAQSEIFFAHIMNFPEIFKRALYSGAAEKINCLGVSVKPRPLENSYMPAFKAGESIANILACAFDAPVYATTHQEGHIKAALWSANLFPPAGESFLAVHISGGTSEILRAETFAGGFKTQIISQADVAAGKFIDGIAAALGLPFPGGPHLEKLAAAANTVKLPVTVKEGEFFFSGAYSAAGRLLSSESCDISGLSAAVFNCIGATLVKALNMAVDATNLRKIILCGGVLKNRIIRSILEENLAEKNELYFAANQFCGDNAAGVAVLALEWLQSERA
jgi:N6-L-threonylcarbamoyladenine synthase